MAVQKSDRYPGGEEVPAEFQADLAALDRLNDEALWQIVRSHQTEKEMARYQELLDKNANEVITTSSFTSKPA